MVLFYLTNMTLDVALGVSWWIIYKTSAGIYYLIYGSNTNKIVKKQILSEEDIKNNSSLDKLIKLQESNQLEIKKLTSQINILNDYVKNL